MAKPLPIHALAKMFGGNAALARAAGVSKSLINKWEERQTGIRKPGHIPSRYNAAILAAARKAGLYRDEVAAHLDMHTCPLCQQTLPRGAVINMDVMRRIGHARRTQG